MGRGLRHPQVHLPPFRLEREGFAHPVRGVPGDDLLLPDPAVLPAELPHPGVVGRRGRFGEFPPLLELPGDLLDVLHVLRLHLRQEGEHLLGERVRALGRGRGEKPLPLLLESQRPHQRARGTLFSLCKTGFRHLLPPCNGNWFSVLLCLPNRRLSSAFRRPAAGISLPLRAVSRKLRSPVGPMPWGVSPPGAKGRSGGVRGLGGGPPPPPPPRGKGGGPAAWGGGVGGGGGGKPPASTWHRVACTSCTYGYVAVFMK